MISRYHVFCHARGHRRSVTQQVQQLQLQHQQDMETQETQETQLRSARPMARINGLPSSWYNQWVALPLIYDDL